MIILFCCSYCSGYYFYTQLKKQNDINYEKYPSVEMSFQSTATNVTAKPGPPGAGIGPPVTGNGNWRKHIARFTPSYRSTPSIAPLIGSPPANFDQTTNVQVMILEKNAFFCGFCG